nr:bifunctional riboflavin kinase/FAD synthetase [Eubacterium sp.]
MIVLEKGPYQLSDTAVCIGKFDGLHSGHQLLIDAVRNSTCKTKVMFTFTFETAEHIYSTEEKKYLAEQMGIDVYIACPFDQALTHMSPLEFLENILIRQCGAKEICVGEDFRFGFERKGDVAFLAKHQQTYGYRLRVFEKKKMAGECVSSTRIRKELKEGSLCDVNELLGRPYMVYGEVQHGNQIGRTLNMPTANQIPSSGKVLPAFGVYASRVYIGERNFIGVTNVGMKPTIPGESKIGVETYIMNFDEDIYGQKICVELHRFLRGEKKFSSLEELEAEMKADKDKAFYFFCIE